MQKRLEWSLTARADLRRIAVFYLEAGGFELAEQARQYLQDAAQTLVDGLVTHRHGKRGTRELVLSTFPYVVIYRVTASRITIVRVLHQSRDYFTV